MAGVQAASGLKDKLSTLGWIAQVSLVALWWLFLRPLPLGGPATYVIVSGISMEPTLEPGDLALLLTQERYTVGDVVAFRVSGTFVIHRILFETPGGFVTQGDNRTTRDRWNLQPDKILGRMTVAIPKVGHVVAWVKRPFAVGSISGITGILLVLTHGKNADRTRGSRGAGHWRDAPGLVGAIELGLRFGVCPIRGMEKIVSRISSASSPATEQHDMPALDETLSPGELLKWANFDGRLRLGGALPPSLHLLIERRGPVALDVIVTNGKSYSRQVRLD